MEKHAEFVARLQSRIAAIQQVEVGQISVARAAKDIGIAETTLRSTLQGKFPRSEDYMRKLKAYTRASLDWLICGHGDPPDGDGRPERERILVVEPDLHKIQLIRLALKGLVHDTARSSAEADHLISENVYDIIMSGADVAWTSEGLQRLERHQTRPRLILLGNSRGGGENPFSRLADQRVEELVEDAIASLVRGQLTRLHIAPPNGG